MKKALLTLFAVCSLFALEGKQPGTYQVDQNSNVTVGGLTRVPNKEEMTGVDPRQQRDHRPSRNYRSR
jgi:hypothetical protein